MSSSADDVDVDAAVVAVVDLAFNPARFMSSHEGK